MVVPVQGVTILSSVQASTPKVAKNRYPKRKELLQIAERFEKAETEYCELIFTVI